MSIISLQTKAVIVVCKKYYIDTLVKELGINNVNRNNKTYIPIDDSFETNVTEWWNSLQDGCYCPVTCGSCTLYFGRETT